MYHIFLPSEPKKSKKLKDKLSDDGFILFYKY